MGKSTVGRFFVEQGVLLLDADQVSAYACILIMGVMLQVDNSVALQKTEVFVPPG